jgi:predicted ATPase
MATLGWGAPEVEAAYARARELCELAGDTPQLFPALWGLWLFRWGRGELAAALDLGESFLAQAERAGDARLVLQGHHALWVTRFSMGDLAAARDHVRRGLDLSVTDAEGSLMLYGNHDAGNCARNFGALTLELLGLPDEALALSREALAAARSFAHPFTEALALVFAAFLHRVRGDGPAARDSAEEALTRSRAQGFALLAAWAGGTRGWALVDGGEAETGVARIEEAIAAARGLGSDQLLTFFLGALAEGHARAGRAGTALAVAADALAAARRTGERFWEAELHRLQGEVLASAPADAGSAGPAGTPASAEGCFREAVEVARRQSARALEQRARRSLERLRSGAGPAP